ncbi:hypothetical protein ANN_19149 [Periplaneta americana]|uniref:Uncharacterized protein n=1 Tax=Periplaneta americana TaxID=6978 RepID=A0ABQ8S9I2_PERAM|nr:hypothetical protein ANN_19149 [Periplaneta americana]
MAKAASQNTQIRVFFDNIGEIPRSLPAHLKGSPSLMKLSGKEFRMVSIPDGILTRELSKWIMPHVDILYNQIQKSTADSLKMKNAISSFEIEVIKIRNSIDNIECEEDNKEKRRRENTHISRNVAAKEVCDVILNHVRLRFSFRNHMLTANLFDSKHFPNYNKMFPEKTLKSVIETYPFLKLQQLKS